MSDDDHSKLIAYVMGDAPPAVVSEIERQAASDPELAAELSILRALSIPARGGELSPGKKGSLSLFRRRWIRSLAAGIGVLFLLGGASWAGYELLRTPPLFEDSFSSRTFSRSKWAVYLGRAGYRAEKGHLTLLNRGSVVPEMEFDGPIEIEFDWRWIEQDTAWYAENLDVAIRTSGRHDEERPYGIVDGIVVQLSCVKHNVSVMGTDNQVGIESSIDSTPFPAGEWHHVRIVDDGRSISVYVSGPSIDPKYRREPVVEYVPLTWPTERRIAFYNREYLASTNHESHIDNVVIRALDVTRR